MDELKSSGKPFEISKREVWEAYRQVKANQGAPGVDGVTLDEFEADLKNNLYRIWNRMSSGSYFPPPVKAVEIPKPHGGGHQGARGADRRGQDRPDGGGPQAGGEGRTDLPPDSYGYRPGRSALDAVAACRQRCWKTDWVIDLDVRDVLRQRAVGARRQGGDGAHHRPVGACCTSSGGSLPRCSYPTGALQQRDRGTPQGSAVSPVLANLFLHYAFDAWMAREYPAVQFERYADDVVVHCATKPQAEAPAGGDREQDGRGRAAAATRPRPGSSTARTEDGGSTTSTPPSPSSGSRSAPAGARTKNGVNFTGFLPAISKDALNKMSREVRRWRLHLLTGHTLADLARQINPIVRGWMQLLRRVLPDRAGSPPGAHQRLPDALDPQEISTAAATKKALACWQRITRQQPRLFAHWAWMAALLVTKTTRAG